MKPGQGPAICGAIAMVLVGVGCGGAAPPAPASKSADEPASMESAAPAAEAEADDQSERQAFGANLEELDRLERQLADAERTLVSSLPGMPTDRAEPSAAPPPAKKPSDSAAGESKPSSARPAATSASTPGGGSAAPDCATSCKALSSMRRSRDRICELAGDGDDRCTTAGERVKSAEERVSRAPCVCSD